MDERLEQLVREVQHQRPRSTEREIALEQLIDEMMKLRRICRPYRGQPVAVCEEICVQVRAFLKAHLAQQFENNCFKLMSADELRGVRDQAFKQVLTDEKLTALAQFTQSQPSESGLRKHSVNELIEAIWLVRFSAKARTSLLNEEAIAKTLTHVYEKIDQFDPARGNGQFMAWVNYWLNIFLKETQEEHESRGNRRIQASKARRRLITVKHEFVCVVRRSRLENLNLWIQFTLKDFIPRQNVGMVMIQLLTVLYLLLQLEISDRTRATELFFAIAEQTLTLPKFSQAPSGEDGEASILENLPQPVEEISLSDQLLEYLQTDPHKLLQKHVENCSQATFQAIALQQLEGRTWQEIAASFGSTKFSTFSTFYYRQLKKLAPEIKRHLQE